MTFWIKGGYDTERLVPPENECLESGRCRKGDRHAGNLDSVLSRRTRSSSTVRHIPDIEADSEALFISENRKIPRMRCGNKYEIPTRFSDCR